MLLSKLIELYIKKVNFILCKLYLNKRRGGWVVGHGQCPLGTITFESMCVGGMLRPVNSYRNAVFGVICKDKANKMNCIYHSNFWTGTIIS